MEKKPEYTLCPRCELNYFVPSKNHQYCTVCLAELNKADPNILIPEDEDNELEVLCPVCKINYMAPDEEMCFVCAKEHQEKMASAEPEDWQDDETETPVEDDPIEISLTELEDEENDIEEDDIPPEEFENEDFFEDIDDEDDDLDENDEDDEDDEDFDDNDD